MSEQKNREILFRGKTINGKEWIIGNLTNYSDAVQIMAQTYEGKWNYFVIPSTVGQYTGIRDKNGKRIFEGDIVDYEDESPGQYEHPDSTFINRGEIKYGDGEYYWTNSINVRFVDTVYNGVADCEVIGNTHDNPELLEDNPT